MTPVDQKRGRDPSTELSEVPNDSKAAKQTLDLPQPAIKVEPLLFRKKPVAENSPCHKLINPYQKIATSHNSGFLNGGLIGTHGSQQSNTPSSLPQQRRQPLVELPKEGELVFHCHVFIFAAKYLYAHLVSFSGSRVKRCVNTLEDNMISTREFTLALRIIFRPGVTEASGTSGNLRTLLIKACVRWINTLNKVGEFKALLEEYPDLSVAIISNIGSCTIKEAENVG